MTAMIRKGKIKVIKTRFKEEGVIKSHYLFTS
jgi:hypothetical protein